MNKIKALVPQKVKNYFKHWPLAALANLYYRFPSRRLTAIGVTGTEGKTTTVNLLAKIISAASLPVATVSTVSAKIGESEIDTGLHVTSPSSWPLQKLLVKMVQKKVKYAILEVTSNALDQFRFWGVDFEIGVLTNITRDHLDYHQTFENYRQAKLKLFLNSKTVVLNADDPSFDFLCSKLKTKKIVTYGLKSKADFNPGSFRFKSPLPGDYNLYNCLAAVATASCLGIAPETIKKAIESFRGVRGRMEEINEGQDFKVYVDFAHSPNSLKQVLKTLSLNLKKGQCLIAVFGSAGHRDREKRPLMGEAAGKYADLIVLTADDPRSEKVGDICDQIAQGSRKTKAETVIIENRREAIAWALRQARKGDIVALCGKGHEQSLAVGKKELPWSDQKIASELIKQQRRKQ